VSTRLLCTRLADGEDDDSRAVLADELTALLLTRSAVTAVRAGLPADDASRRSWDLGFVIEVSRPDDGVLAAVTDHLGARAVVVKSWAFDL
jgi:hypothetical protein